MVASIDLGTALAFCIIVCAVCVVWLALFFARIMWVIIQRSKMPAPVPSTAQRRWAIIFRSAQWALIASGLALFITALPLPAVNIGLGGWANVGSGYKALAMGFPYWPSNGLLLLSPILVLLVGWAKDRWAQLMLMGPMLLSWAWVSALVYSQDDLFIGAFLWVGAHCLITTGICIPQWPTWRPLRPLSVFATVVVLGLLAVAPLHLISIYDQTTELSLESSSLYGTEAIVTSAQLDRTVRLSKSNSWRGSGLYRGTYDLEFHFDDGDKEWVRFIHSDTFQAKRFEISINHNPRINYFSCHLTMWDAAGKGRTLTASHERGVASKDAQHPLVLDADEFYHVH